MDTLELFQRMSVALAIGLLVGLERGWRERGEREGERTAGLRTYTLTALLGAVWGALASDGAGSGLTALGIAFATLSIIFAAMRYREMLHDQSFGITSIVAGMMVFALGALAVLGDMQVAAALGVTTAALLALKGALHDFVKRITWTELRSGLLLLAMTFVLLPILPRRNIDPWGAVNPFELWLMTIVIAAISFAGYIAIKLFGANRGIVFSGIAGGLASSTATTVSMAELARRHPEQVSALAAGAMLAGATMVLRILVVVGIINNEVLIKLAVPFAFAALAMAAAGGYLLSRRTAVAGEGDGLILKNPFDIAVVLKFGLLLMIISVLAKGITNYAGSAGAYALAAASSIADVDAVTLSMARLASGPLGADAAATAIAIVAAGNTISKTVIGYATGGRGFGRRLMVGAIAAIAAGCIGYLMVPLRF